MEIQGVVSGKRIELERDTGLPIGSKVLVSIRTPILSLEERQKWVDTLCGAWKNDASLLRIFTEIENQRSINLPRQIDLNGSS